MKQLTVYVLAFSTLIGYISCAATNETDCQRRRRQETANTADRAGLLVPECDEHGEYKALQCFGDAVQGRPFCACYDKEFGQIKGPSKNIKSCHCVRAHYEWEHKTESDKGSEPRCNTTSGEYNPVQCDAESHWCVDWDTGAQRGLKMNGGCTTDLSAMSCGIDGTHHGDSAHHHASCDPHSGTCSHDASSSSHHGDGGHHGDSSHHGDAGQH
uniref:Putative thyropin n=1 Tax=Amblyomma triste TaxID=251400 RepID=A0A023GAV9_AMBTT